MNVGIWSEVLRISDGFPDPLFRLLRKGLPGRFPGLIFRRHETLHRLVDQEELPFVPRAKLAHEKVEAHADPLPERKGAVRRLGFTITLRKV
jgi:hypothetical protein